MAFKQTTIRRATRAAPTRQPVPARAATPPGARARAEAMLAEIERLKQQIGQAFYRIGVLLRQLSSPDLYKALGYASFGALLEARQVMSRMNASRLIEIVERYPAPRANALGAAKAYALTRYAAATDADPAALAQNPRTVIDGQHLADLSVRALQEAAARARAQRRPRPKDDASKEAERLARQLRRWLASRGARDTTIRTRYQHGQWWLRLDIPASAIPSVIK